MLDADRLGVSKFMSLLLRHQAREFGLKVDAQGFVPLGDFLKVLVKSGPISSIALEDVRKLVAADPKGRYEIVEDRIRARYGHSIAIQSAYEEVVPPPLLFHGTAPRALSLILRDGLKPQNRQFVHLSADERSALEVGRRHAPNPIILSVDATAAHQAGVKFFKATSAIFLTKEVPARFLRK